MSTDLQFKYRHMALRNGLYHKARQAWYERINRLFNLLILLSGSSTLISLLAGKPDIVSVISVFVVLIGGLQLVYDFAGKAHLHGGLQRRYFELMADAEHLPKMGVKQAGDFDARISLLTAEEPQMLRVLDQVKHNEASSSLCGGAKPQYVINQFHHLTRHLFVWHGVHFTRNDDWLDEA